MAYAFVQQNANDDASSATTITVTLTPTAGNLLVFALGGEFLDTTSIALSDDLGVHNTFSQIDTDLVLDQRCAWWYAANCKGGSTTFTATFSGPTRFRLIYVAEYSGIATTSPFLNGTRAASIIPGTGTDAVSSGTANATSQPALVWGFSIDVEGSATPSAGTGFTSRTGVWSAATSFGRPEDKRVTTTGNVAATFTAVTGTDTYGTGIGIFLEATVTPTLSSWSPNFPDRIQTRSSVSALGTAVAPVLTPALTPLSWRSTFPDRVPARPIPNLATGSAVEPVFVPAAAPPATPMSWSPRFPDFLLRVRAAPITGGMVKPEATLPNPPAPALSWSPRFPDIIPRPRSPLLTSGVVAPIAPNLVPSFSWFPRFPDIIARPRSPLLTSGAIAPTLSIPNASSSVFPLTVSSNGRHFRKNDGTPFLICADSTWSIFVDIPLTSVSAYFSALVSQGFNALMGNAIEHHYSIVNPPKERSGLLPFTQRLDGAAYTGSPNGATSTTGTQGQFGSDAYSSPSTQSPDCTFINNSYWLVIEQILDTALANNLLIFIWPGYLGFQGGDQGWMLEMTLWDAVIGAGGFTGQSFADPTKSKLWNYGAWLAARWKNYPNIIWTMGGDYGTNSNTLSTTERAAVVSLVAGLKSVTGQQSTLWTTHWDRPCISDDNLITGVTWDMNFCYSDEAVAELCRRGYSTAAKPSILGEYNYEDGLFGGNAPWRKYTWWGFLGGIAGGFYGHEQLWRFDDGTPGTDWQTLLATQARLDVIRQFAFLKSKPWHRLVPNGLGGIGTLITAGGGTASPQSTDYVAAAATPEKDLLLAYVPPAHTGSVTIDMTKLGATITARWFDPANATFTNIGTFSNTGTNAFSTPGTNSAGDADWLLVLDAPDSPLPLSWKPTFPDRTPRSSLTLAQVVSGETRPVAPAPPVTLNWSPNFADSASRARQPVNTGGMTKPEATLPNPTFSWVPSFPDRTATITVKPHSGSVTPLIDTNAGPLTWLSNFPDSALRLGRAPVGGMVAPPSDTNAGPLTWGPNFPDRTLGPTRAKIGGVFSPPTDTNAGPITWNPNFPSQTRGPARAQISGEFAPPSDTNTGPLTWLTQTFGPINRLNTPLSNGESSPLLVITVTVVPLSWTPTFPDSVLRTHQQTNATGVTEPEATLPNAFVPPLSWSPNFADFNPRAQQPIEAIGVFGPVTSLPNPFVPLLGWAPSFPDRTLQARRPLNVGGSFAPDATLPNPPVPLLSWSPYFPDITPKQGRPINQGGIVKPEDTLPNPPAPILSWSPRFPDTTLRLRPSVNTGGSFGPSPGTTGPISPVEPFPVPPGRASIQLAGHVVIPSIESRDTEDTHLFGVVRSKKDV